MRIQKKCEHTEQVALVNWARANEGKYPELRNLFAIPNGGHRHLSVAKKLKAEGVRKGVLDIFLAHPVKNIQIIFKGYSGLFIEMKFGKNKLTKEQKEWIERLTQAGYKCSVCYSFEEARDKILNYLGECQ
jgi:hypothetical protein